MGTDPGTVSAMDERNAHDSQEGCRRATKFPATSLLVRRIRDGDRRALETLLQQEVPWIRKIVHRRLGGVVRAMHDTDDVVHDLVVRILTRGPVLQVESRSHFQNLMACMVRNSLCSKAKPNRAQPAPGGADRVALDLDRGVATTTIAPPDAASKAEECAWLWLAVEFLDDLDQDVVRLRAVDGLTFGDIGERLGMQENAVNRRYSRALKKLGRVIRELRAGRLGRLLRERE